MLICIRDICCADNRSAYMKECCFCKLINEKTIITKWKTEICSSEFSDSCFTPLEVHRRRILEPQILRRFAVASIDEQALLDPVGLSYNFLGEDLTLALLNKINSMSS